MQKNRSRRVADESVVADAGARAAGVGRRPGRLSALYGLYRAATPALACFSGPRLTGVDRVRVSGELVQSSEVNRHVVRDSTRFAILM